MPAAYHSAPVVVRHRFQAGTATVMKAANSIAAWNICPHMRIEWKTVWPPRSVLPPRPRIRDAPPVRAACRPEVEAGRGRGEGDRAGGGRARTQARDGRRGFQSGPSPV